MTVKASIEADVSTKQEGSRAKEIPFDVPYRRREAGTAKGKAVGIEETIYVNLRSFNTFGTGTPKHALRIENLSTVTLIELNSMSGSGRDVWVPLPESERLRLEFGLFSLTSKRTKPEPSDDVEDEEEEEPEEEEPEEDDDC